MKLITRATRAIGIAARWRERYAHTTDEHFVAKGRALEALPIPEDPDKVDEIIGNTSWTRVPQCDECGRDVYALVTLGAEQEYSSSTNVCADCLASALELARAVTLR